MPCGGPAGDPPCRRDTWLSTRCPRASSGRSGCTATSCWPTSAAVGAGRLGEQAFLLVAPDPDPALPDTPFGAQAPGTQIALHHTRLRDEAGAAAFVTLAAQLAYLRMSGYRLALERHGLRSKIRLVDPSSGAVAAIIEDRHPRGGVFSRGADGTARGLASRLAALPAAGPPADATDPELLRGVLLALALREDDVGGAEAADLADRALVLLRGAGCGAARPARGAAGCPGLGLRRDDRLAPPGPAPCRQRSGCPRTVRSDTLDRSGRTSAQAERACPKAMPLDEGSASRPEVDRKRPKSGRPDDQLGRRPTEGPLARRARGLLVRTWRGTIAHDGSRVAGGRSIRPDAGPALDATTRAHVRQNAARPCAGSRVPGSRLIAEQRLRLVLETERLVSGQGDDLQGVMQIVADRMPAMVGASGSSVSLVDGDMLETRAISGAALMPPRRPIAESLSRFAIETGGPVLVVDARTDPRVNQKTRTTIGNESVICVPFVRGGEVIGILHVFSDDPARPLDENDAETLKLLSVVVSAALARAAEAQARREAARALSRFRDLFEGASLGILRLDREGVILEANPAVETMLGEPDEVLIDRRLSDYLVGEHGALVDVQVSEAVAGDRGGFELEVRSQTRSGTMGWCRLRAVVDHAEATPHVTVMVEDVSERKHAEAALTRQLAVNEHQALHDPLTGLPKPPPVRRAHRSGDPPGQAARLPVGGARHGSRPASGTSTTSSGTGPATSCS